MSNAMNEGSKSGMGATALVILVLSFLIPGWTARALGLAGPLARLLDWMTAQQGLFCLVLWLAYGLIGFLILLAIAAAIGGTGLALLWGLRKVKAWALRASVALARLLGLAMLWLAQVLGEWVWDVLATQLIRFAQWRYEQRELRRLYREEYAADFLSYRASFVSTAPLKTARIPTRGGADATMAAKPRPIRLRRRSACWACPRISPATT
jgi:hypothetical protein